MARDAGIGIVLLGLCAFLYWQAGLVPAQPFVPIGASVYPRVILILLAALSLWLILESLSRKRAPAPARPTKKPAGPAPDYRRVLLAFAVFLGYVVALSFLGFISSTFLFVLGLGWAMGPRKPREVPKLFAVAAGTAVVTYLIFEKYLYVFLPRGFFF